MPSKAARKIDEAIKIFNAQPMDFKSTLLGVAVLAVAIAHVVVTMSRDGTEEDRKEMRDEAINAWRESVTPIDIPGIPNFIEPFIDNGIETGLAAGFEAAFTQLDSFRKEVEAILDS